MFRLLAIALVINIFPGVLAAPEAGDLRLPHAAPGAEEPKADFRAAILKLGALDQSEFPADDPLCGLSKQYVFAPAEQAVFENALKNIPCRLVDEITSIRIYDEPDRPRALAGANSLHFRSDFFSLAEAEAVLIHELGHIADLSGLKSQGYRIESGFFDGNIPIFADDPSVGFYSISWQDNEQHASGTTSEDFVTEYAMTDPFEDFAESFLFYIRQGNSFRAYAKQNPRIKAKYEFLKESVFDGTEFLSGKKPTDLIYREWDATRME